MLTFTLANGYDRRKTPAVDTYRAMTAAEARNLQTGMSVPFLAVDGTVRTVKVNGAPKTWKRDSARVEVPVKYGMYEYTTLCARADGTMDRLLVKVNAESAD